MRVGLIMLVSALGLASRRYASTLPLFLSRYAGDTLWALAVFLGIGFLWPGAKTRSVALLALGISVAVELSQLYHASWIDAIRGTAIGGLALGYQFVGSDLVCYTAGVGLGALGEWLTRRGPREKSVVAR